MISCFPPPSIRVSLPEFIAAFSGSESPAPACQPRPTAPRSHTSPVQILPPCLSARSRCLLNGRRGRGVQPSGTRARRGPSPSGSARPCPVEGTSKFTRASHVFGAAAARHVTVAPAHWPSFALSRATRARAWCPGVMRNTVTRRRRVDPTPAVQAAHLAAAAELRRPRLGELPSTTQSGRIMHGEARSLTPKKALMPVRIISTCLSAVRTRVNARESRNIHGGRRVSLQMATDPALYEQFLASPSSFVPRQSSKLSAARGRVCLAHVVVAQSLLGRLRRAPCARRAGGHAFYTMGEVDANQCMAISAARSRAVPRPKGRVLVGVEDPRQAAEGTRRACVAPHVFPG